MKKALIFPQFQKSGGTRTYFKNLIIFYVSIHYEIAVAIDRNYCDREIMEFLSKNNIRVVILENNVCTGIFSRFPSSMVYDLVTGIPVILRERPDLILISVGTFGKFFGLMLLHSLKTVYILHTYPECIRSDPFYRLLLSLCLSRNKNILTVSQFSRMRIITCWRLTGKREYIRYIYNFSELEPCHVPAGDNGTRDVKRILTLGHVVDYKNPDVWYSVAVKTLEKYQGHAEFVWAGDGNLLELYREKARTDNIPQIRFLGLQDDIAGLYDTSDIYFQPSRLESHGIAVLDAMLMALPCVVSDAGGLPESVIHGKTGYVIHPDNTDEMVSRILDLLEHDDLRSSLGKAGKERYEKTFTYRRWMQDMKALTEKLV